MAKTILGIDIGTHDLKIAQVRDDKIQKFATAAMPDNVVQNGRVVSFNVLADIIKETVKDHHLKGAGVAISLPAETYYLRKVHLPKMTIQQLNVNLPFEFHDYITGGPDSYNYDYAVIDMDDNNMDLMAAAMPKETVEQYQIMVKRAGLKLVKLVPDVLAIQSILMNSKDAKEGKRDFAVLDIGHSATRMHFYSDGNYEITRTLETSANQLAQMLADARNIDIHIAQLTIEHNQDGIMNEGGGADYLEQMSTEVMRVMNFYGYNNPNNTIDCIYFYGNGMHTDHLRELIHEATELAVRPLTDLIDGADHVEGLNNGPAAYGIVTE